MANITFDAYGVPNSANMDYSRMAGQMTSGLLPAQTSINTNGKLKDMDVQRLVDVLWSQDIDLGAGRETFEYPIHPPKSDHQKSEPKLDGAFPPNGRFSTFTTTSQQSALDQFFVDDETGEVTSRTATGNDTGRDAFTSQPVNGTQFYPPGPGGYGIDSNRSLAAGNQSGSAIPAEDQQLQSLIEALNSLNSSTLQAAVTRGQNQTGKGIDEQWQDVESVISPRPGVSGSYMGQSQTFNQNGNDFSNGSSFPSGSGSGQTQSNGSMPDLNTFDLFSMFMDPPKNWTLPTANSNSSGFYSAEYNSSDITGYRQNSPVGVVPEGSSNSGDMFSARALQSGAIPSTLIHEGPFDLSAFSYAQPPLVPQMSPESSNNNNAYASVPSSHNNGSSLYNPSSWNISDWQGLDLGGYNQSNNGTGVNSQNGYYSGSNQTVDSGNWKLLQEYQQPTVNNITDAFLLLDDASKLQLLDLDVVVPEPPKPQAKPVEVKQEEVDPWTEHVNYATNHNHTYATKSGRGRRDRGRSMESRDGSEDGRQSFSGSTGSGSGSGSRSQGQSRQSRDDRAASELRLPVTAEEIISMPVEEFNGYISGQVAQLHNDQIQLMKDIRRRGKNKVAAQNCRRRKIDNMSHLEREIMDLQTELKQAQSRHSELTRERDRYRAVLRTSVIQDGSALSSGQGSSSHQMQSSHSGLTSPSVIVMSGGSIRGLRRQDSGASDDQSDKPLRKRKRND